MKYQLKDVRPNPFRRSEKYPILKEKVEELVESIQTTGFWENIVGREVDGKLQVAYGHHRLEALKKVYPVGLLCRRHGYCVAVASRTPRSTLCVLLSAPSH